MFPGAPQQMLQQQWMQASSIAQQGIGAEMAGNVFGAAQCFEQAAAVMASFVTTAQQFGVPVNDQGWFHFACCHFNAARAKSFLGRSAEAWPHLMQAHNALNYSISLNPYCGPYHSLMGVLLSAQGRNAEAIGAFTHALNLNRGDEFARRMLAILHQSQGNVAMVNQFFAAAQQQAPALPPPAQSTQRLQSESGGGKGLDLNGIFKTIQSAAEAISAVGGAMDKFGLLNKPAAGGHQASGWPEWSGGSGGSGGDDYNAGNYGQGGY
jgi:tetratricopeptide (TPR) repeat protein